MQQRTEYALTPGWRVSAEIARSDSERVRLQDRIDIGNNLDSCGLGSCSR